MSAPEVKFIVRAFIRNGLGVNQPPRHFNHNDLQSAQDGMKFARQLTGCFQVELLMVLDVWRKSDQH